MVKGKGKQICMILALVGLLTGCGSQSKVPDDYATNEGYQTEKADAKADTETNTADTIFSQVSMWTATDSAAIVLSGREFSRTLLFDLH